MIHLYRVYFDSVADATEVYAASHADAAVDIAIRLGRNAGDAVVRYLWSVNAESAIAEARGFGKGKSHERINRNEGQLERSRKERR